MRFFILLSLITLSAWAKPKFPSLNKPVIDLAGILSKSEVEYLSRSIYELHAQGGPQTGVFIADSLQGYAIEDYSIHLSEAWELGGNKNDNGLIFLIAPKGRKLRIEVGGGIEGNITDLEADRWIRNVLTPSFQQGQFASGIAVVLMDVADRFGINLEETKAIVKRSKRKSNELSPLFTIILLIIFLFVMPILHRARGGVMHYGGGGRMRGGFGGGGFGGGGGWGGGGGGFSGGGASGSW